MPILKGHPYRRAALWAALPPLLGIAAGEYIAAFPFRHSDILTWGLIYSCRILCPTASLLPFWVPPLVWFWEDLIYWFTSWVLYSAGFSLIVFLSQRTATNSPPQQRSDR
jgi:hypothetical protein